MWSKRSLNMISRPCRDKTKRFKPYELGTETIHIDEVTSDESINSVDLDKMQVPTEFKKIWEKMHFLTERLMMVQHEHDVVANILWPAYDRNLRNKLKKAHGEKFDIVEIINRFIEDVLTGKIRINEVNGEYSGDIDKVKTVIDALQSCQKSISGNPTNISAESIETPTNSNPQPTKGIKDMNEIYTERKKNQCSGTSYIPPRIKSYNAYKGAYESTSLYRNVLEHLKLMTDIYKVPESIVTANSDNAPYIYGKMNTVLFWIMKAASLQNRNEEFLRNKIPSSLNQQNSNFNIAFSSTMFATNRERENLQHITPVFIKALNDCLLDIGHISFYLDMNPDKHFSDIYMGIWLLVAWYLIKYEERNLVYVMKFTYQDICTKFLEKALEKYLLFISQKGYEGGTVGYKPTVKFDTPLEDITNLMASDTFDPWKDFQDPTTFPDLDKLRWDVATGTVSHKLRGFDFSPYITWPHSNEYGSKNADVFSHEMEKDSFTLKDLVTRVLMSTIQGVTGSNTNARPYYENMQQFIADIDKYKLCPEGENVLNSCQVFSTLAMRAPMRRMSMVGINCLLTAYCLCQGVDEQRNKTRNGFQKVIIKHLIDIPEPRYTPSTIVLPGLWKLLILYEDKELDQPYRYHRHPIVQQSTMRHLGDSPWALKRFVQLLNLKTKQTLSTKEKSTRKSIG